MMEHSQHGGKKPMNKNVVIAVVLGVLVLIAAVQAFQLVGLKARLAGGTVQTASAGAPAPASGGDAGAAQLPANIQNLPSMVGGC
jgi:hypothetical protein